jgi:membrane-associated PAP2 superfamily phosphatase
MTDSYVPCWALTSAPLRLEIQWVSSISQFLNCSHLLSQPVWATTFSRIQYIANYVEVSDSGMEIVQKSLNGGSVEWVTQAYSNYYLNNR